MSMPGPPDTPAHPHASPPEPISPPEPTWAAPWSSSPPELAPLAPPGPARPLPRRHRVVFWLAVLASLAAIGGGGYLAVTTYQAETAPERVVLDYLEALAAGDAAAALAYGAVPAGDQDLLTDEVLAAQLAIAPITDLTVDVDETGATTAEAEITYELAFNTGAVTVEDVIPLVRSGRTWRLGAVAVPITMRVTNGASRATVAGAEVPDGPQLVFPGAVPIAFDTEHLALDEAARVVRFADGDGAEERAVVSEAGREAIGAALDAALADCLAGTAAAQTLCPLPEDARSVPGSLRGELAEPASDTVSITTQAGNDGLVRITGEITVAGEYQQLDFNNQRVTEAGDHVVQIVAVCFATSPETIIWRPV